MSSEAVTEISREKHSAWTYRSIFLSDGIVYAHFFCPYCDIPLIGKNIDSPYEIIKSPHFAVFPKSPHIGDCDGEAISSDDDVENKVSDKKINNPRYMKYPEELIERPSRKEKSTTIATSVNHPLITLDEIRQRRISSGKKGRSKTIAYLLQPFIEAKNLALKEAYEKFPDKAQTQERNAWISRTLTEMKLKLDDETNYQQGFKTLAFPDKQRRIYSGIGKLTFVDNIFSIQGKDQIKSKNESIEFAIYISLALLQNGAPKSHNEIIGILMEQMKSKHEVRFHCYGLARKSDSGKIEMHISSLDYIYVKKPFIK